MRVYFRLEKQQQSDYGVFQPYWEAPWNPSDYQSTFIMRDYIARP